MDQELNKKKPSFWGRFFYTAFWVASLMLIARATPKVLYFMKRKDYTTVAVKKVEKSEKGIVTKVIDGDTIIVNGSTIRLLGIDARERGEKCYDEAKQRLEELVLGKNVTLKSDVMSDDVDQYGRYLRYVFLPTNELNEGLTNINLLLVEEGLAIARTENKDIKFAAEFVNAEKSASLNHRGCLWQLQQYEWKILKGEAISPYEAWEYVGLEKIVEGRVADVYRSMRSNTIFLNFEKPYPNNPFTAVIFSRYTKNFPPFPEFVYEGKTVRVKGKIKLYKGRPEIILKSPNQIEVEGQAK